MTKEEYYLQKAKHHHKRARRRRVRDEKDPPNLRRGTESPSSVDNTNAGLGRA